ncbi:MAG: hypothetical protein WCS89_01125 [Candidatus Paceibacterota bacterium]|jgi:hypothetical protein
MFTHPNEIDEYKRQGARKMGIIVPSATYSGKQITVILLVFASLVLCGLYLFK